MPSKEIEKIKSAHKAAPGVRWGVVALLGVVIAAVFGTVLLTGTPTRSFKVGSTTYHLEEARSDTAHAKGLSGRDSLAVNGGMLFIYDKEKEACFWMKETRFALDMIWVDAQKRIVAIEHDVAPATYPESFCHSPARYVIELKAGEAARHGLLEGQRLNF